MTLDFVIVGAGIGGTVLAETLGRAGKKVLVLEKSTRPALWTRPEILWPPTVRVLFSLLPARTWEAEAMMPLRDIELRSGERFVPVAPPDLLRDDHIQPWSTDPNATRELLMGLGSFELRRGVEVKEVLKEGERIVGVRVQKIGGGEEQDLLATWTVGDDGANSAVRRACGIAIRARTFPLEFFCFACDRPGSFPEATVRLWPNLRKGGTGSGILLMGVAPIPHGRGAGLVVVHGAAFRSNPRVPESWSEFRALDSVISEVVGERRFPADFVHVQRPWGHARHYGAGGALLMGDAAHPVSPAGGQGANMSVADARAIADLALCNDPDLLASYEVRRRPANRRSLLPTRIAASVMGLPRWCRPASLVFRLAGRFGRRPSVIRRAFRFLSSAFLEGPERAPTSQGSAGLR